MEVDDNTETIKSPIILKRDFTAKLTVLSKSDGSCDLSHGQTTIITSVYGPTESRMNREKIDRAYVDVMYRPKVGIPTCVDKLPQNIIEKTCESVILATLHPRTAINVTVQELEKDGSVLSSAVNCVMLALMDACVPMKHHIAAVSVAVKDNVITIDPTNENEREADAILTVAFESNELSVVTMHSEGIMSSDKLWECVVLAREASSKVFKFYRDTFQKKLLP